MDKKLSWNKLAKMERYSGLDMAIFLYPNDSPKKIFNRCKFLLRSFIYHSELMRMYFLFQEPQLKNLPENHPKLLDKPLRPYRFAAANAKKRAQMVEEHYHLLGILFPNEIMALYNENGVSLGRLPISQYNVVLCYDGTFRREGELTISIINEQGIRLYSCAFSLAGNIKDLTLVIGAVQGPAPTIENAPEIIRTMTKELHGLRPKSFVVMLVIILAKIIKANNIQAVKKSAHVFQAQRYSKKQKFKLHSDYDSLWHEFGAVEIDAHLFQLNPPQKKPLDEIIPKKRAMYRRRYDYLEGIEKDIISKFSASTRYV